MSNQNMTVQRRQFIVKAGMTAEDVKNSKEATALQKKYANAFDSDGQKGFSQKEADLFNATTFSEKADGSVTFWTRQKDGTKKGIKFTGNLEEMNYSTKSEVKPYVTTKKVIKHIQCNQKAASKKENVSFFDSKWSGAQIAKLTGDNAITDWLQDKDKVCTDGKDDGKIGFWEGVKSFGKGLLGGIPKMVINHPLTTAVTVGVGAIATAIAGASVLVPLAAVGLVAGVGMVGYGAYKAATAKTDGEAKQALETCGLGVATTALTAASAGSVLDKAAKAGVKSAQVAEDAGFLTKIKTLFKAAPEALNVSGKNIKNVYTMARFNEKTLLDGTKQKYSEDGTILRYNAEGKILTEAHPDGTYIENYTNHEGIVGDFTKTTLKNGTHKVIDNATGKVVEIQNTDGTRINYCKSCDGKTGDFTKTALRDGSHKVIDNTTGKVVEIQNTDGTRINYCKSYNGKAGDFTKTTLKDGTFSVMDNNRGVYLEKNSAPECLFTEEWGTSTGQLFKEVHNGRCSGIASLSEDYPVGHSIFKEYSPDGYLKKEIVTIDGPSWENRPDYYSPKEAFEAGRSSYLTERYKVVAVKYEYDNNCNIIKTENISKRDGHYTTYYDY